MHETIYAPDCYILEHHGIKGQKWGVRRFRNKDGTITAEGRKRQLESRNVSRNKPHTDDVNDIVRTLSKKERDFLGAADNEDWIDKKSERDTLVNKAKTFVSKEGGTPVSFVEIWTNGGRTGQISLATRNDPKYRGKGYASKNVEQAIKWADRYGNKSIDELEWIADRKNTASVNLGKKYGFVEDNPNKHGHNWKDDWSEEYAIMYRPVKHLAHHGVKGMKWGVRRKARKDAKEYARAKMYYGEGAGNRRKLIKATVKERSKDPAYKKEFERQIKKQDMAKHASAAKRERKVNNVKKSTAKTARGLVNAATGNIGRASATAAAIYLVASYTGADKVVAQYAKQKASDFVSEAKNRRYTKRVIDEWLKNSGRK